MLKTMVKADVPEIDLTAEQREKARKLETEITSNVRYAEREKDRYVLEGKLSMVYADRTDRVDCGFTPAIELKHTVKCIKNHEELVFDWIGVCRAIAVLAASTCPDELEKWIENYREQVYDHIQTL